MGAFQPNAIRTDLEDVELDAYDEPMLTEPRLMKDG
jgi:hypothetical protein